ncbi:hypothetical protein ACFWPH_06320 [Nocardia sp. NPDC058499]|uniref:hypothetical protein n=1 Tax=Nocardia sp. NPDC058499 TaxID=3346530 RepID=UPI0036622EB6
MSDKRLAGTGAQTSPTSFAARLDRVETWSALAQRWEDPDEVPDWATGTENELTIALGGQPNSQIAVSVDLLVRDEHPRAVRVEIVAFYELAVFPAGAPVPAEGNVEDTSAFVSNLPNGSGTKIVNRALRDIAPYLREAVHSTSARVLPEYPVLLPGGVGDLPESALRPRQPTATSGQDEDDT